MPLTVRRHYKKMFFIRVPRTKAQRNSRGASASSSPSSRPAMCPHVSPSLSLPPPLSPSMSTVPPPSPRCRVFLSRNRSGVIGRRVGSSKARGKARVRCKERRRRKKSATAQEARAALYCAHAATKSKSRQLTRVVGHVCWRVISPACRTTGCVACKQRARTGRRP